MNGKGTFELLMLMMVVAMAMEVGVAEVSPDKNIRGGEQETMSSEPLPESTVPRNGVRGMTQDFFSTTNIDVPVDVQYLRSFVGWQYVFCAAVACLCAAMLLVIIMRYVISFFVKSAMHKVD
jgi:hypothetical protein